MSQLAFSIREAVISGTSDFTELSTNREGLSHFFPCFNFFEFQQFLRTDFRAKHRGMILPYSEILVIFSLKALSTKVCNIGPAIAFLPSL